MVAKNRIAAEAVDCSRPPPENETAPVLAGTGAARGKAKKTQSNASAAALSAQPDGGDQLSNLARGPHVAAVGGSNPPQGCEGFEPQVALSPEELCALLTTHEQRKSKDGAYITRPMTQGDHSRSDANAGAWRLVPVDIDELQPEEQPMLERWFEESEFAGFIWTTFSHRPDRPKLRLLIESSRETTAEEHPFIYRALEAKVPFKLDPCMCKPSQPIFLPSCPPEHAEHAFARYQKGKPLDIDRLLAAYKSEIEAETERRAAAGHDARGIGVRSPGGLIDWFNNNCDLPALLVDCGYRRKSMNRYVAPESKSGRAAVIIGNGGKTVVSFHDPAHDPLAVRNKSHQAVVLDAFAVYCKLKHGDDFKKAFAGALEIAKAAGWEDKTAPNTVESRPIEQRPWPDPPDPAAYHGLAGEIVDLIDPHSEADRVAILVQVLAWFGAAIGRVPRDGPHYLVESDKHYANLFAVLIGETSKARKGTSLGRVREIFRDADFLLKEVNGGMSTGEGLKWNVRDRVMKREFDKRNQTTVEYESDPGVTDKRLLVAEPEFAQVLKQGARTGNTLSTAIRCAFDSGNLITLTKTDSITVTGAHISIIGHITQTELSRELTATESANGFANRFLYVAVRRSKELPFGGGKMDPAAVAAIKAQLRQRITDAKSLSEVAMTDAAKALWVQVYHELSAGLPGMLGAVTGRAEAYCCRLALIYALLDGCTEIDEVHLQAGLALWDYCLASARYIFGSALGDPVADAILGALRAAGAAGLTRTAISGLFKGHKEAVSIDIALRLLESQKLSHAEQHPTGGRSAEVWKEGRAKEAE